MRNTFIQTMIELARQDPTIMLVIGDTGFSVVEPFEQEFKERFVNVGIAEQNFVAFAAGAAAMGMKPFAYNVVSFMTLRAAEHILLDVCYQENPVVLVGVGGGFAYGSAGPTHHALQDIAMMRCIPNMTVYCPGDPVEMKAVMLEAARLNKPAYIRIGRSVDPIVHHEEIHFETGKAIPMCEGKDVAILACGTMLKEAAQTCNVLKEKGISCSLYSFPTIKPLDVQTVLMCARTHKLICTVEEHSVIGGFGSAVAEVLSSTPGEKALHKCYGVPDSFAMVTGTREYQLEYFGISPEKMAQDILKTWETCK